jgi:hypothetical protein
VVGSVSLPVLEMFRQDGERQLYLGDACGSSAQGASDALTGIEIATSLDVDPGNVIGLLNRRGHRSPGKRYSEGGDESGEEMHFGEVIVRVCVLFGVGTCEVMNIVR